MSARLITYELKNPEQNLHEIVQRIKSYEGWAQLSESSYAVVATESLDTIFNDFRSLLNQNDILLVVNLTKPHVGRTTPGIDDWLRDNL